MSDYLAYQEKYRDTPRESDRLLIELVSQRVPEGGLVLDVGCSTGNLLRHLRAVRPDLSLVGMDLSVESIGGAKADELASIHDPGTLISFNVRDVLAGPPFNDTVEFHAAILNAVLYCLNDQQTLAALCNIHSILRPGGHLFIWDYLQHWEQRLTITEESERYGKATFHIRPYSLLNHLAKQAGFTGCEFVPFCPSHLPVPDDPYDLTSWTYSGNPHGFSFRGGLAQPWCHAVLTK